MVRLSQRENSHLWTAGRRQGNVAKVCVEELDEYLLVAVIFSVLSLSKGEGCQQLQVLDMTDALVATIACDMRRAKEKAHGRANSG